MRKSHLLIKVAVKVILNNKKRNQRVDLSLEMNNYSLIQENHQDKLLHRAHRKESILLF
jgi:hypothetical protein